MSGCKINCEKYMKYNGTMRGIFLGNGTVQIFWDLFENGTKAKLLCEDPLYLHTKT